MARQLRVGEMLVALEGLALYRTLFSGTDDEVAERLDGMRSVLAALAHTPGDDTGEPPIAQSAVTVHERSVVDGYAEWSATYDDLVNPLIEFEEATLTPILDALVPGRALDACCGSGRVLAQLLSRGHDATGIDGSPAMLALAASKVGSDRVAFGDIADPTVWPALGTGRFDTVTCCLALTHYASLVEPLRGIAATARTGATVVLTDIHPFCTLLDAQGFYVAGEGRTGFVRNHVHTHADYLAAFRATGCVVRDCVEPKLSPGTGAFLGLVAQLLPRTAAVAYTGVPFVLVWVLERVGP